MLINEIRTVVEKNHRNNEYLERDIQIINTYFGMGEISIPTLENTGKVFGNLTRESVRQKIEHYFSSVANDRDLPSLRIICDILTARNHWIVKDYITAIVEYVGSEISIYGLLNLIDMLNYPNQVKLIGSDLSESTQGLDVNKCFIVNEKAFTNVIPQIRKILKKPGKYGLFRWDIAEKQIKGTQEEKEMICNLVKFNTSCKFIIDENHEWYIAENYSNVITNSLGKLKCLTESVNFDVLCDVITGCVGKRSSKNPKPDRSVIKKYLEVSDITKIENSAAHILIEPRKLEKSDICVIAAYHEKNTQSMTFPELCDAIKKIWIKDESMENLSESYFQTLYHSPLIYVDKSNGRSKYKFDLIGKYSYINDNSKKENIKSDFENSQITKLFIDAIDFSKISELNFNVLGGNVESPIFPDEVSLESVGEITEGATKKIVVNSYERDKTAREKCIIHYLKKDGAIRCQICGFDFGAMYGSEYDGLIHVHHIVPLSEIKKEYKVNPEKDLIPVCPNCHMVLHSKGHPSVDELRDKLVERNNNDREEKSS